MAESSLEMADQDILPDGVEPESSGIPIFDFLDEGNLVEHLDSLTGGPQGVASLTIQLYDDARATMAKWLKKYDAALKLAKLEPETEKKTFPFDGASTVMMPFILETMLDFHSRTVPELVWAKNVVNVKTYGQKTPEKERRAKRVSTFMNYQISEQIKNWRIDQDKLLLALPCVGTAYKEIYYNGDDQIVASDLLMGDEVIFSHDYRTFDEAPDKFIVDELTRNEVLTKIRGDEAWLLDERDLPLQQDHPEPFRFLRAYTWIDLDQDGLSEPYRVIIYQENDQVVAVYPAYQEEEITVNEDGEIVDVKMMPIFTQYRFLPDPEGGPMGMGWGVLLGDLFTAINTDIRQLIDAGTLANLAGSSGLIDAQMAGGSGRGNRQQSGPIEVRMGELTPITTGGKPLAQSLVQFPYQGPNATLFSLLEYMVGQVREMTNSALNMETNSQEAAMMYLARLQQGLKVPNSIVMRVYDAARHEFKQIAALNYRHYSDQKYNRVIDEPEPASMRDDFNPEDCDIRLAVDPTQGSDIERQQRSSVVLEEAKQDEQGILNRRQAYLDWLEALKVPDVDALAPEPSGEPDPMQQLMLANMQRQADLEERDMLIREARLEIESTKEMLRAMKEGAEYGLQFDKTEAEISAKYADAFYKLWQMDMAGDDPVATVEDIERRLIDKQPAMPPPVPMRPPVDTSGQPPGAGPMAMPSGTGTPPGQ